ncbi:hypothetical protein DdX_02067 [Ditylenchus destructor]|uniref:Uncharacterized protein n=1 Tax=Ditylenchus destructor TaxID=166010 RepID=A0AAD4NAC4_9BILA|nr:hypothetical protein DdX_02067 [Ditylenchus destructor]
MGVGSNMNSHRQRFSTQLLIFITFCLFIIGSAEVDDRSTASLQQAQGKLRKFKNFFDSIDKNADDALESKPSFVHSYALPQSNTGFGELFQLQRRSASSYANRRSAHPCRWKLCGAYHNYSRFRSFL